VAGARVTTSQNALLVAAQRGDEQAFVELTGPHRRALHVHAYRMLANLHDADDALQETLVRAWRALPGYEPRAALSTWLHRIATNVALRMLEQRRRARAARRPRLVGARDGGAARRLHDRGQQRPPARPRADRPRA
jgi:RNA polymerase sigma factor (sigma-70 family)